MENKFNNQIDIIAVLSELERNVGRLYEAYGFQFPEHRSFWQNLANEEKEHAIWLEKLGNYVRQGQAVLNEKRFNIFAARSFLNYLKSELDKAARQEITIINAAAIALYLEESIMEHNYYEVISGDAPELQKTFDYLTTATSVHIKRVKEFLDHVKKV